MNWLRKPRLTTAALVAGAAMLGAAAIGAPSTALACGGFFCNNQPIDQSGEEIIFTVDKPENRVRAIIRISYVGEASDFAWVLPVNPGLTVDRIGTSSDTVFQIVRQRTNPIFNIDWISNGDKCNFYPPNRWAMDAAAGPPSENGGQGGGVTVVDQGQVGAYDVVILTSTSASELVEWLNANGFVQPASSTPLIDHYLQKDFQFVALKLQQNKGTGDITPVVLELDQDEACVPIVLTQIAATPDMPIRLWVLGESRSIPTNWFHVKLNYKKLDWIGLGWQGDIPNYTAVVTEAINEAEGRGFITEYAGPSDLLAGALYSPGQYDLTKLKQVSGAAEWVMLLQSMFTGTPELLEVLRTVVPLPAELAAQGVSEQSFYNCPDCYAEAYAKMSFDAADATALLEERIVVPLRDAQKFVDSYPYLTRVLSIVSPDEMTRDPIFDFSKVAGNVPREHVAKGEVICDGDKLGAVMLTFPDGGAIYAQIPEWYGQQPTMGADDTSGEPFASSIELLSPDGGAAEVPRSMLPFYDRQLDLSPRPDLVFEQAVKDSAAPQTPNGPNPVGGVSKSSGGCNATGQGANSAWFLLGALAVAAMRGRRNQSAK